jgi:hypothetical protein
MRPGTTRPPGSTSGDREAMGHDLENKRGEGRLVREQIENAISGRPEIS